MAKFKIYKLRFTSPLHLGDERADYDKSNRVYHSDSMYAAMTSALAKVGVSIPSNADFGFAISSLFPYYQKEPDSEAVYFLPRLLKQDQFEPGLRKKVKKVEWLDVCSFNKQLNGENLFEGDINQDLMKDSYFTEKDIDDDFISNQVNQRVKVSRDGSEDARPFYMERLFFKGESGLLFLATDKTEMIDKALDLLKDEGIGTDRTVGNGFFTWTPDEIKLELPKSNMICNLSMFIPETKEQLKNMFDDDRVAYNFQKRGGWITDAGLNTYRKNNIYMFNEGSIFKNTDNIESAVIQGKVVNLKPEIEHINIEHPIYRDGRAIFIPVVL